MKYLLVSDPPGVSAYGTQAGYLAQYLKKWGNDVIWYAPTYEGLMYQYSSSRPDLAVDIVPGMMNHADVGMIISHAKHENVDAIITLKDPYVYGDLYALKSMPVPWIAFAPIHTEPISPKVLVPLQQATSVISLTPTGQRLLGEQGIQSYFAPHGFDNTIFKPNLEQRRQKRQELGIPEDVFVFLFLGANQSNPSRKLLDKVIMVYDSIHRAHPDTMLYLHTDLSGTRGGIFAFDIIQALAWDDSFFRSSNWHMYHTFRYQQEEIAALYNMADATISIGHEGFDCVAIESQMCGTPVVATNFAAHRDTVFSKWKIAAEKPNGIMPDRTWENGLRSLVFVPPDESIFAAFEAVYKSKKENPNEYQQQKQIAYQAANMFNLESVMEKFSASYQGGAAVPANYLHFFTQFAQMMDGKLK